MEMNVWAQLLGKEEAGTWCLSTAGPSLATKNQGNEDTLASQARLGEETAPAFAQGQGVLQSTSAG